MNLKNKERSNTKMNARLDDKYVFVVEEGIKHKKIINKFQDWLINTMNNLIADDITSKNHDMNTRYKYSIDYHEHPSRLDPSKLFFKEVGFIHNIHSVILC